MHLFLTGEIQVGKSTLLSALLRSLGLPACGFCTCWRRTEAEDTLHLLPWGMDADCGADNQVARRRNGRAEILPGRFDALGPELLTPRPGCAVMVMDELGFLERNDLRFQEAVLCALDGPLPVLGVIKPRQEPFLDRVRAHAGVQLVTVTPENRDDLRTSELLAAWCASVRSE